MRTFCRFLPIVLGLVFVLSEGAAAAPADRCIVNRGSPGGSILNFFIFKQVTALRPGGAIALRGIYFTPARKPAPFHGSAMMGTDGRVRLGIFVHSSAESTNDFTLSGVTDANFVGIVKFDNDGDFVTNGTLPLEVVSCETITVP
jgi:hypothetical protein